MWNQLTIASAALWGLTISAVKATYAPTIHSRQSSNASTISWSACPDSSNTQCAIFDVPMDYTNPENGKTVSIFMRKYAATAPEDQRLGSILVNPGGPGGSGTAYLAIRGEDISIMVDGRYDIISFDPRGVNLTGPPTACYDTEYKFAQRMYQLNAQEAPFPHIGGAGEIAHVAKLSAIQSTHPKACTENGNHDMLTNSGTVAVAKDMERIVQALGEDGLNFLGYSYGSILGATFAAMRPHLVKRMVLDGISDAEVYYKNVLEWGRTCIQDTHKTIAGFVSTCIEAGPTECALASRKDNKTETVEGLTKRIDALYTKLGKEPLVVGDSVTGPGIIQANSVQSVVFSYAYTPVLWKQLATELALLEQGDGRDFYPLLNSFIYGVLPEPYTQNVFNRSMQRLGGTGEAQYPVLCGDSPRLNVTVEEYADYFRDMGKNNSTGEPVALIVGGCRDWPFRATERYTGPWSVDKGLNKTRFPILLVSTDADPVTPLPSALKMNRAFGSESSTLLIQHGFGHPSYSHPSLCTVKNVHDYFVNGIVPKNGTHCTSEPGYIYPTNSTRSKRSALSKRDAKLLEAVERLGLRHAKSGMIPGI
ncbi:alpha/beta hydrolase family protein [Rhizoctonia solani]|uniref:Alpha/beta hydrolase family protein n=1 Tax=Rhizoctonia solani TaxID=456999 RepID=A0A8H8P411_9AGAM|nr:alpha/beta hydrolase family protein [Rhizoctonia solani]QRW24740.1 alpha/beta hydrolase family protein [Rhizoctonia solani]